MVAFEVLTESLSIRHWWLTTCTCPYLL